jgi:ribosomal protein L14E/L6E/L27E
VNTLIGTIVKAYAGRDGGDYFLVVASDVDGFVYIVNGKSRKLLRPKKKNVKHLQFTKTVIELDGCTDKRLRKFLAEYKSKQTLSGGNNNV